MIRKAILFVLGAALILALPPFLLEPPWAHGAISPISEIMATRFHTRPRAINYDSDKRLISFDGKLLVPCPPAGPRTAVLLIAGQSNAANSAGQKYHSTAGDAVLNFFDGKCYLAQSPLLGSTGEWGEPWTLMANNLVQSGAFDRVVLIPVAVSGSSIQMWTKGRLRDALLKTIASFRPIYRETGVIWYQGEADFILDTSEREYAEELKSVALLLRDAGVSAPIYVAAATRCGNSTLTWSPDNPISRAQKAFIDPHQKIFGGADADGLLTGLDRYDDCHLSASGVEKIATSWAKVLTEDR